MSAAPKAGSEKQPAEEVLAADDLARLVVADGSFLSRARSPIPTRQFDVSRLSSGQLHFYLERRYSLVPDSGREAFAEQLIYCLEKRFAMEPYHVKLAILNAAGFARTSSVDLTERLIVAVQALEVALGDAAQAGTGFRLIAQAAARLSRHCLGEWSREQPDARCGT